MEGFARRSLDAQVTRWTLPLSAQKTWGLSSRVQHTNTASCEVRRRVYSLREGEKKTPFDVSKHRNRRRPVPYERICSLTCENTLWGDFVVYRGDGSFLLLVLPRGRHNRGKEQNDTHTYQHASHIEVHEVCEET